MQRVGLYRRTADTLSMPYIHMICFQYLIDPIVYMHRENKQTNKQTSLDYLQFTGHIFFFEQRANEEFREMFQRFLETSRLDVKVKRSLLCDTPTNVNYIRRANCLGM